MPQLWEDAQLAVWHIHDEMDGLDHGEEREVEGAVVELATNVAGVLGTEGVAADGPVLLVVGLDLERPCRTRSRTPQQGRARGVACAARRWSCSPSSSVRDGPS